MWKRAKKPRRDLKKVHTVFFQEAKGPGLHVGKRKRYHPKHRFVTVEGETMPDRRRLKPSIAGRLGSNKKTVDKTRQQILSTDKTLTGTAKELYINLGPKARGLGTKNRAKSRKRGQ